MPSKSESAIPILVGKYTLECANIPGELFHAADMPDIF
jgi:hypothetical protein